MTFPAASVGVPVVGAGRVAGIAWVNRTGGGMDLHVLGKLVVRVDRDGEPEVVESEAPGTHRGVAAPEEVHAFPGRRVIVRGHRAYPGRVLLRRGSSNLVDAGFAAGAELVHHALTGMGRTTMSGERGEWLVVEGASHPQARRWCKLPKLGVVATWQSQPERLVLRYRLLLVDVAAGMVGFLYRGTRPLGGAGMPLAIDLSALSADQLEASLGLGRGPSSAGGSPRASSPKSDGITTVHPQGAPQRPTMPFAAAGAGAPFLSEESATAVNRLSTGTADTGPVVTPAVALPGTVPEVRPAAPRVGDVRAELERRARAGLPVHDLPLRGLKLGGIVLVDAKLAGMDLSTTDLRNADLSRADLTGARLDDVRLDGAKLTGAILERASLDRASLREASMAGVRASGCSGAEVDLEHADLTNADLRSARLLGVKLARSRGPGMLADDVDFTGGDLTAARFERASFRGAVFRRASIRGALLTHADLTSADLREIAGENALQGAKLDGAQRT